MGKVPTFCKSTGVDGAHFAIEEAARYGIDDAIAGKAFFNVLGLYCLHRLLQKIGKFIYLFRGDVYHQCFTAISALCAVYGACYLVVEIVH